MRLAALFVALALAGCGVRGAPKPPRPESQPAPSAPDAGAPEEQE